MEHFGMERHTITSDTQTQGKITKTIDADNYMDALLIMDNIVDEMDGHFEKIDTPPDTLTFDEILSDQYGVFHNYIERGGRWQIVLITGWFYTGDIGSELGTRCNVMNRLDTVMMH